MITGSVRFRFNNCMNIIDSNGNVVMGNAVSHNCIAARLRQQGGYHLAPFGGFLLYPQIPRPQYLKLSNLFGYTFDDVPQLAVLNDIPASKDVLGCYSGGKHYVMLDSNMSVLLIDRPSHDRPSGSNVHFL